MGEMGDINDDNQANKDNIRFHVPLKQFLEQVLEIVKNAID